MAGVCTEMPDTKNGLILNVDDNEAGRYSTTKILKNAGFDVIEAANGTDALTLAADQHPDLVLLDVKLPDISGFEVCKRLRQDKQTASILVVHQSATFVRSPDQVKGLEGGADGYLVHPIEPDVLVATLRSYLRIRSAEKALRESEEKFRQLFAWMPSAVAIYDATDNGEDFIFIDFNAAAETIDRLKKEDLVGKRVTQVFPGVKDFGIFDVFQRVWRTGQPEYFPQALYRDEHHPGTWRENWVYKLASGEVVAIYNDITERKRAEETLRESEERYRRLFETAQDGIIILDEEMGTIIDANAFILELLGYPLEYFVGRQLWELGVIRDKSLAETAFGKLRTEGYVRYEDLPLVTKGGQSMDVEFISNVYFVGEKKIIQCNIRNITDRKRAEDALALASRKLNLLSGITRHDINNQLLVISSYLEISKKSLGNPARTAEFIAKEQKTVDTIAHQISFTKDYEEMGIKAPVWQKVHTTVMNVITRLPMRDISIDAGDPDLEIFADSLLEKVFYNLFDNALRYGGEKITAIRITNHRDNGVLVIAVEDDGNGISAEDKKQLFTKGFGRHTGLGLFLSREILSITSITITENGEPGKGARFECMVPKGMYRFPGQRTDKKSGGAD